MSRSRPSSSTSARPSGSSPRLRSFRKASIEPRWRTARRPRASRSSRPRSSEASGASAWSRTEAGMRAAISCVCPACSVARPRSSNAMDRAASRRTRAGSSGGSTSSSASSVRRSTSGSGMPSTVAHSLLELVGSTPLVELRPVGNVRLYAKLEGQNPTGSIKDRVAKAMIEAAEASGELEPGRELLEPTRGNTGISLALVAKLKGYPLTCVMPENATEERKRLLRLFGAKIVFSPPAEGSNGAVRLALELAEREPRYFMPFQYANAANPRAHHEGTGAEIVDGLDRVDVLVAGLGTGGTLMGTGERLRESFPDVLVAAAEPLPGDPVMGLRSLDDGYVPPILDVSKLDRKVLVSNEESVREVRRLLDEEGIFAGVSAGAVGHVARTLAAELDEGVVVAIFADAGWKYLSADFWEAENVEQAMERSVWW